MKKQNSLTREQRQIRFIPLVVAIITAIIYLFIDLGSADPFVHESLFGWEYQWELSRYIDILMIYLASVIFVTLCQKNEWLPLAESFFINVILLVATGVIAWLTKATFLPTLIIVFGAAWGLMYSNAMEIGRNLLMLFVGLTFFFGLVNAFIMSLIVLFPLVITFYLRLLTKGSDFRRFVFWLGLAPDKEYGSKKDDKSNSDCAEASEEKAEISFRSSPDDCSGFTAEIDFENIIDLSADPEEINGFTVKRHIPGESNFRFSSKKCSLYLSFAQKEKAGISGPVLMNDPLIKKKSFNANLLDWLIDNQEKIPAEWKNYSIPFWGTLYERNSIEHVRCLVWDGNRFTSEIRWLTRNFDEKYRTLIADS